MSLTTHVTFFAEVSGAQGDYSVSVEPVSSKGEVLMTIFAQEGPIYITKAQAMEFFNLIPKPN